MTSNVLRPLVGSSITVETDAGLVHGTLLSCTARSLWLIDDGELDVVLTLDHVVSVACDAA